MQWDSRFDDILRKYLSFLEPGQPITEDLGLRDYGLDSLGVVDLLVSVELEFGVTLRDEELTAETFETPAALWSAIAAQLTPAN
jgi:acyl carrier protein